MQAQVQEKFKILYSLEEIMQNGYPINTTIPKEKRCPYCNKVLEVKGILNPVNHSINAFVQNEKCNCSKAIEEQKKLEAEKEKQLMKDFEKYRKEEFNKKFDEKARLERL